MFLGSSWATRLASFAHLSSDDEGILSALTTGARQHKVDEDFVQARDAVGRVLVVVAGMACRCRLLPDGRRQILSFLFPGDMTSPEQLLVRQSGQPISMLVPSEVALLDRDDMEALHGHPNICDAFSRYALVKDAIATEWQVNVGLRTAQERVSHLLCEMYARLESIGLARGHVFKLPLTQCQLADSVALSAVHVNRVLMELRRQKVLALGAGMAMILDYPRLRTIAGFDSAYLQTDYEPLSDRPPVKQDSLSLN